MTAIATALIAVGAFVAFLQFRETKKARHTEAAARMSSRWEDDAYVAAREKIDSYSDNMALRDAFLVAMDTRSADRHLLLRELSFLEELGAMEQLGATSLRWVDETMRDLVLARWNLWEPTISELRTRNPYEKGIYKNFQHLEENLRGVNLTRRQQLSRWLVGRLSY